MTDKKLLASLSKLGLPMFEPSEELDVNETLAEVVKSHKASFPFVFLITNICIF
jgi:hypothetical protein